MSWKDRIPGCFGEVDQIFAGHPKDAERAAELLLAAKQEQASLEEIEKAIRVHLAEKGAGSEHADEQISKVREKFGPWF